MDEITDKMESINLENHPSYSVKLREQCYHAFFKNFSCYIPEKYGEEYRIPFPGKQAQNIEKSCYNYAIKNTKIPSWKNKNFVMNYSSGARKVLANITYTTNAKFVLDRILEKEWKLRNLVFMTHKELDPIGTIEKEKVAAEFLLGRTIGITQEATEERGDGMFQCGRCKSKKTEHTQKQTRSADEPMTIFIYCNGCGNRWKQ